MGYCTSLFLVLPRKNITKDVHGEETITPERDIYAFAFLIHTSL